ncbi:MAG: hypothetical protein H7067_10480 [Burkholderiales bacterium]|nr:hypothetical protein [Opitutaceae bacterium]
MKTSPNDSDKKAPSSNPDPITGAPGSHPIGTGLGAVAGGAATGAAVGTFAGPVGTAIGAAAGAIVGGLAGKGVAEKVNPTAEDAYWRENHLKQPYANGRPYDDYSLAYRNGYEGYADGDTFEDREEELRRKYESTSSTIAWPDARAASHAAWQRRQTQGLDMKKTG